MFVLSVKHLKERWRSLYGTEPPGRISRELLTRAIAYRLQERRFADFSPGRDACWNALARAGHPSQIVRVGSHRKAAAGTVLIREWQGTSHRVTVLNDGVIYHGRRYQSLSEVARVIGETRLSGPCSSVSEAAPRRPAMASFAPAVWIYTRTRRLQDCRPQKFCDTHAARAMKLYSW